MNTQDQNLVRQMIQQEMTKSSQANRFNLTNTTRHQHTRNDIAAVNYNDIAPGTSTTGTITFAQQTTYNIGVNFNPKTIFVHGNIIGNLGERFITTGSAVFGPSFYLQPGTSTSVKPGGLPETIIQSSTCFGVDTNNSIHTVAGEEHIVDVEYPLGTIHARMTVTGYSNKGIIVSVDNLSSGWTMNLNFTIS